MVKFAFDGVSVKGISAVVPPKEILLTDDKELYNGDKKRIKRLIDSSGFLKRRVAAEDVLTSDLCLQAAEDLISNLKIDRNEIDALFFISYTPDYLMPATSYVLHKKLGLSHYCVVMDIPQACSGFVIGLCQASMFINSGCRKVLLLVGDTFSKFTDMFKDHTAPVFGDAGTATLIEYDETAGRSYFNIMSDGSNYDALICSNGGFRNIPKKEDFYENGKYIYDSKMNGGRIFDFTMSSIAPSIEELLSFADLKVTDIDKFIFHQANKFIIENLARKLKIPFENISAETLTDYGNQCGASIPCTIANVYSSDVSRNNLKCLMSGFGVGLSWANAIIDLNRIYCSGILEYKEK